MNVDAEKRLLLAVLTRRLLDYGGNHVASKEDRREAAFWLTHWKRSDTDVPFTFPWICSHFGFNPYKIRKELEQPGGPQRIADRIERVRVGGLLMYGFSTVSPEQRLGIEIIKRAINDYMGRWYTGSTTESDAWETDAKEWLFHTQGDYKLECSFEWWCQFLNLSPDTIRANIERLRASEAERRSVRLTSVAAYEDAIFENVYGYDTEERFRIIGW